MVNRVCIIVLDSAGIGALPDAPLYGDCGANTLGNIYGKRGVLRLPHLYGMGLAHIEMSGLPLPSCALKAAYGRMAEVTRAKDTTSGHWEMAGLIMDPPFRVFPNGFPAAFLSKWINECNVQNLATISGDKKWLCNAPASGTEVIKEFGEIHMKTGAPIVYTSADSVFQVAAHEGMIPLPKLYGMCALARGMLVGDMCTGRVIARPFAGAPGSFSRTENRRDYSVAPVGETVLDGLENRGMTTLGIGKIEDIFCGRGVTHSIHTTYNRDGIQATVEALQSDEKDSLIFANLVDFDMLYGHRNDVEGYAAALEYFDERLPEIMAAMRRDDVLFITADHGCDPTLSGSTDHTREYVPVLVYGPMVRSVSLGTRSSFADLGATVYSMLTNGEKWCIGNEFVFHHT